MTDLLSKRHAQMTEQRPRLFVRLRCRHNANVHASRLLDYAGIDLGTGHPIAETDRVIASHVEGFRRNSAEVAHGGQRDVEEAVQELVPPVAAQRHRGADVHSPAKLESRGRLFRLGTYRPL